MARKVIEYTVKDEGRDQNKVFVITEMPARQAMKWATRALVALVHAGVSVPDEIVGSGLAGIAAAGFGQLSNLKFADIDPLMDELLSCVQYRSDPVKNPTFTRPLFEDAVEEVSTYFQLQKAAFDLHTGFLQAVAQST